MIGRKINNYKFISELGEGGMGMIYKAYDTKLDRYVAIKILKQGIIDQLQFIERFKREAKNQAKLSHQNIVPVYGFIDEGPVLGIVMEYVEGETLEQIIERKGRLDLFETMHVIKQALSGIGYAHSKGFIHRDIKPSNIIINSDGITKIMDFGISKSQLDKDLTSTGKNVGTLYYMSPEQIRGEDVTIQGDIYSFGITLYEMLTGVPPYNYETVYEVMEAHMKQDPPGLLSVCPELPAKFQDIIERAIDKKPQNRYDSCEEFLEDIYKLETEVNKFHRPRSVKKRPKTKNYKAKTLSYTFIILLLLSGLFYFAYDQVLELWNTGFRSLMFLGKSKKEVVEPSNDDLPKLKWVSLSTGVNNNLNSIFFLNDSTGFSCGTEGMLLKSVDYGKRWYKINSPTKKELFSICFTYSRVGFLLDDSTLYKSDDLGTSWKRVDINPMGKKLLKVRFIDHSNGYIVGSEGLVIKSSDGGKTWHQVSTNTTHMLFDVDFADETSGYVVGRDGEILKTTNSGDSWIKMSIFTPNYLKSIRFINPKVGFVVGGDGEIFRTDNGGQNWTELKRSDISFGLYDVQFIDEQIGFIIGGQGKLLMTVDGGKSWSLSAINVLASLNDLTITPSGKVFAAGQNGTIVKL